MARLYCVLITITVHVLLTFGCIVFALDCPSMPVQATKDAQGKVSLAVGRMGAFKGGELEIKAESITKDLLRSLPNADKVYLEQMMFSAYCSALRDDKNLKESEKADRIKVYREGVQRALIGKGKSRTKVQTFSPEIRCKLEYPFKLENGAVRKQINNPKITIVNLGPIKVVTFSVDFKSYLYDVSNSVITQEMWESQETHGHLIFVKELQPSEDIKQQLSGFHCEGKVGIYIFALKYYREADMKMFTRQDMFFIEDYEIYSEKDYKKNKNYPRIIQAIKSYKPASNAEPICLHGIDDHVWFVKETPKTGVYVLGDDGKSFTMADATVDPLSIIKQKQLYKNRPLLYVTPWIQKEKGTYLLPEIVSDDNININIAFLVENIGDQEAFNVSVLGGEAYNETLRPGEKIYYKNKIALQRRSGDTHTAQQFMSDMDKQERILKVETTVLYSQGSGDKEYMTRSIYEIGKSSVKLMKYETK